MGYSLFLCFIACFLAQLFPSMSCTHFMYIGNSIKAQAQAFSDSISPDREKDTDYVAMFDDFFEIGLYIKLEQMVGIH